MNTTSHIIQHIASVAEWHIEEQFGMKLISNYMRMLNLSQAGFSMIEKTLAEQKAKQKGEIVKVEASNGKIRTVNGWRLHYAEDTPANSFAYLKLQGLMSMQEEPCAYGIPNLLSDIDAALSNENVVGIFIETNTGGGEAQAGKALQVTIEEAASQKPVVTWVNGVMASAGVMGTLASTEIIARPKMSEIGSIGTYMAIDKAFVKFLQENFEFIYADDSTNKNPEFRALMAGDLDPIRAKCNLINKDFLANVSAFRPLKGSEAAIKHTLSGAVFNETEAKSRGLIDAVGNKDFAFKRLLYHSNKK